MDPDCPICVKIADPSTLAEDELVWEFPHSVVLLGPWQFYEGYCVVAAKKHVTELFEMSSQERHALMDEVALTAKAIHRLVKPRKINYEWLGNLVPHMHWHLFPRQERDRHKMQAVWVDLDAAERSEEWKKRMERCRHGRITICLALRERLEKWTRMK